ncbi:MAG: histidine phosphatase family protein [Sphingobacteriales bacterium]|nr:MAG: histidine phosphatase family protein [Sphingobacteriales bacterium]TAF80815.1 MAG: histidine phosphatase family protein [Sphingobacteriales bacterium]
MQKKIYIIRHGETDLNKDGIVQGRGINSDLNQTGIAQSKAFFKMYQTIAFDKIYTSTLKRTHQTAAQFIAKGIAWEQLEGFDELAWGIYEGKTSTPQLREDFKILIDSWANGYLDVKIEDGESPNEVYARQHKAIDYVLKHKNEKTVLICMHGRAIRLLLCLLLKKPLSNMDEFPHQNTSLYVLNYYGDMFEIEVFNSLQHLEGFR